MAVQRPLVEGPLFVSAVRSAQATVEKLAKSGWNFDAAPEVYAKSSQADVLAKEMVHIFNGKRVSRIGRLVMGGVGQHFNLMGPIPANSEIQVSSDELLDVVNRQLGRKGLYDHPGMERFHDLQDVEFYNYGTFHTLEEMVLWLLVHETGCFPSTLQHMVREFARGRVVQNYMYRPAMTEKGAPVLMQGQCLSFSFPSAAMEWMDKPLYGGFAKETMHVETLLTADRSDASHPHLPLVAEGKVRFGHQVYYAKRFVGTTPKDGIQPPGKQEGPNQEKVGGRR